MPSQGLPDEETVGELSCFFYDRPALKVTRFGPMTFGLIKSRKCPVWALIFSVYVLRGELPPSPKVEQSDTHLITLTELGLQSLGKGLEITPID